MTRREKLLNTYGFDDTIWMLIGIPVVSFVIPLLFFNATLYDGVLTYLPNWGVSLMYTCAYWFSTRLIFAYFRKKYPRYNDTRKRLIYTFLAIIVMFIFWNQVLDVVHEKIHELGKEENVTKFDYIVASFTILALVGTLYESIFFNYRWKQTIIETEQLKSENVQSQLEGLKNQVNPHFLFNSLNTLTYIIPEDSEKAIKFVQKLSKVYRYILEIRDKKLIPLAEELEFLHSYIFLLKERFGESLHIELKIPEQSQTDHIVPLSLQILFENAIKHNIISSSKPLYIEVLLQSKNRLLIRNNLQKKRQAMPSTKVGLQNIKNRYAYFSDEKVVVNNSNTHFAVSLPLIPAPSQNPVLSLK